jgi:putative FmdB family regulatory protein
MPLYEYQCGQCGRFEVIQKFSDPILTVCPTCGKDVQKLLSSPAIQFKGSGWYITDYARKSGGGGKSEKSDKAEGSAKSEGSSSGAASTKESSGGSSGSGSGSAGGSGDSGGKS